MRNIYIFLFSIIFFIINSTGAFEIGKTFNPSELKDLGLHFKNIGFLAIHSAKKISFCASNSLYGKLLSYVGIMMERQDTFVDMRILTTVIGCPNATVTNNVKKLMQIYEEEEKEFLSMQRFITSVYVNGFYTLREAILGHVVIKTRIMKQFAEKNILEYFEPLNVYKKSDPAYPYYASFISDFIKFAYSFGLDSPRCIGAPDDSKSYLQQFCKTYDKMIVPRIFEYTINSSVPESGYAAKSKPGYLYAFFAFEEPIFEHIKCKSRSIDYYEEMLRDYEKRTQELTAAIVNNNAEDSLLHCNMTPTKKHSKESIEAACDGLRDHVKLMLNHISFLIRDETSKLHLKQICKRSYELNGILYKYYEKLSSLFVKTLNMEISYLQMFSYYKELINEFIEEEYIVIEGRKNA